MQVVTFVLRPAASYRAVELDVPAGLLGLLGATFALAPLLLAVPIGQLADRAGERRVMVGGAGLLAASGVLFSLAGGHLPLLVLATVVLGVGHLCSVVAQQAYVANTTPAGRYDAAFGYYTFAASAGQAAGPALIAVVGGTHAIPDTQLLFLGATLLTLPLIASAAVLRPAGTRSTETAATSTGGLLRAPGVIRALTVSAIVLAAVDVTLIYLPALGAERGISAAAVGALLGLRAATSMASRFLLGRLTVLLGRRRLLIGGVALSAAGIGLLVPSAPVWVMALLVAVTGFGLGVGQPLTMSFLAEIAPAGARGRAMSLRLTGNRLGQVLIPSAAGLLATGAGAAGVLACTAAGLTGAAIAARSLHPTGKDPS